jgi:hypothetical protein
MTGSRLIALFLCPLAVSSCTGPAEVETAVSLPERISSLIEQYDAQGHHRTGTAVDRASADWLAELVEEQGFEARLDPFPFERTEIRAAWIELADGQRFDGYPLLDSPLTGPEGTEGELGELAPSAEIAVLRSPPLPGFQRDFNKARRSDNHRAMLMVTGGEEWQLPDGLVLMNAERYEEPFGPPVLQLPTQAWDALSAQLGTPAKVVTDGVRVPGEAFNLVVTVPGGRPELAPIVVMTPRSGWYECASERGGGIALWVEMVRALRAEPPVRTVHFVATTGHEVGKLGLEHFLDQNESLVRDAHLWIDLGASFAAVDAELRLQGSDEELLQQSGERLRERGIEPAHTTPIDRRPLGDARKVYDRGGRYLSILSTKNGHFHSATDRWPDAVELDRLVQIGRAMIDVLVEEAQSESPERSSPESD